MELNKNDIHNILIFLNRTKLEGTEVPVYVEVYGKLKQLLDTPEITEKVE